MSPLAPVTDPTSGPPADLDVVIPAYNEEHRLPRTIAAIADAVHDASFSTRVLVVDNGSVDATADAVDAVEVAHRAHLPIDVLSCRHQGKGAAVRAGVLASSAPEVAYCDADLSTPPTSLGRGHELLADGYDVVVGSRRAVGASYDVAQPLHRRVGSQAFRFAARGLVDGIADTQCGFKMLDGDLARTVFRRLRTRGFAFDVEMLALVRAAGASVVEMPVSWRDDEGSSFRPLTDGVASFRELRAVRRALAGTDR